MENRIQELTTKIYVEGVEKGAAEGRRILNEALAQRDVLLREAAEQAEKITADARKEAEELKKNTRSELQLYTGQALEALKSEIANLISASLAASSVEAATADPSFMQKVILTLVQEWVKKEELTIETTDDAALIRYFEANAKNLLNNGVTIHQVNGRPASFAISPSDGTYKVTFGEDEFKAYFTGFLRPQLIRLLFSDQQI